MKCQFKQKEKILVSLKQIGYDTDISYIKKYRHIYLYRITDDWSGSEKRNLLYYLDKFVLWLPEDDNEKRMLWNDFYSCYAEIYEELIDIKNNLLCIETMICQIEKVLQKSEYCCLDYGCGTGLSSLISSKGTIVGYEPVKAMREYATQKGMIVYSRKDLMRIPNEYFDAVFASYVFHMAVEESDIVKIVPKMKNNAVWIVNFYKGINEKYINSVFENIGFNVKRINIDTERFGHIYEYTKKGSS